MSNAGRHTKKTPEIRTKILNAISEGNTHKVSCALAGVSTTHFYDWIQADAEFSDDVKAAEAISEAFHVEQIRNATNSNWQASAWMLERRNNKEWGRFDRLDITSKDDKIEGFKVIFVGPDNTEDD